MHTHTDTQFESKERQEKGKIKCFSCIEGPREGERERDEREEKESKRKRARERERENESKDC